MKIKRLLFLVCTVIANVCFAMQDEEANNKKAVYEELYKQPIRNIKTHSFSFKFQGNDTKIISNYQDDIDYCNKMTQAINSLSIDTVSFDNDTEPLRVVNISAIDQIVQEKLNKQEKQTQRKIVYPLLAMLGLFILSDRFTNQHIRHMNAINSIGRRF